MRSVPCVVAILSVLLFVPSPRPARAGVPATIPFQGRLTAPTGQPVADTDAQTLTFRLYDAATGGTLLWSQTSSDVHVRGGVFSAMLDLSTGFTAPNTLDTALAGTPYLEVQAGDDPPMSPRLPFSSAPYALRTRTADLALTVPDGSITAPKLAPGAVSATALGAPLAETLSVLSIGTAATPTLVSTTNVAPTAAPTAMAVSGGRLYVVGTSIGDNNLNRLGVFDVTQPVPTPRGTATFGISSSPRSIAVSGNAAYVVGDRLMAFDISDPSAPHLLGSVALVGHPSTAAVAAQGNTVYVLASNGGITTATFAAYDVSDPSRPAWLDSVSGSHPSPGGVALAVSGDLAFASDGNDLVIYDVSDPRAIVLRGRVVGGGPSGSGGIAASGKLAYVLADQEGLLIVDASDPDHPDVLSTTSVGESVSTIAVSGGCAYIADYGHQTLTVVNISDSSAPTVLGTVGTGYRPVAVAVDGQTAYVLNQDEHSVQKFNLGVLRVARGLDVSGRASFGDDVIISGKVGIGTTPTTRLDVNGTVRSTGFNMTSGAATFLGNVGIGTATPTAPLDVNGAVKATGVDVNGSVKSIGLQITSGAAPGRVLTSDANGVATWQAPAVPAIPAIVAGEVSFSGGILNGTGFTVARIAGRPAGGYHITFTTPFLAAPVVTATPYAEDNDLSATYANPTANGVDIIVTLPTQFRDTRFSFIAVGTR